MHVILQRPNWSAKFILQRPIGVQNLFCKGPLECKIYFAFAYWSAKFILRLPNWSAKFILRLPIGVQNLFCVRPIFVQIYFAKGKIDNVPFF